MAATSILHGAPETAHCNRIHMHPSAAPTAPHTCVSVGVGAWPVEGADAAALAEQVLGRHCVELRKNGSRAGMCLVSGLQQADRRAKEMAPPAING